jgi:4-amino-4-deoxy-L-arabinose transferase-like glycosyltransferase
VESYSHRQPVFYYFYNIIWQLFPWTVFLPLTACALWRQGALRMRRDLRFLLVWLAAIFVFFTLISGKRSQYILPLFPAAGLLMGWALAQGNPLEGMLKERKDFRIPLIVLLIISFAGLAAFPVVCWFYLRDFFVVALALALAGAAFLFFLARKMNSRPPAFTLKALLIIIAIATATAFGYVMPEADTYKSARPFCAKVLAAAEEADPILFYQVYRPNINYYMGRSMKRLETQRDVWRELDGRPGVFLVLESRRLQNLSFRGPVVLEQVTRERIGSREMVCVKVSRAQPRPNLLAPLPK